MHNYAKQDLKFTTQQDNDLCGALMNVIDEILGNATLKEPDEMLKEIVSQFGSRKDPFFKFIYTYHKNLNVRFAFNSLMIILPFETKLNLLRYAEMTWPKEQYIFSKIKEVLNNNWTALETHKKLNLFLHQNQNKVIHFILGKRTPSQYFSRDRDFSRDGGRKTPTPYKTSKAC